MHTTDDSISSTCRCREYCESWGAIYSFLCMQIVRIAQFPNDDRSVAKAFSIIYAQFNKNSGRIRTPSDSRTAAAPFIFLWLFSECALARLKWMEKNRTRRAKKIHFLLFAFFSVLFYFFARHAKSNENIQEHLSLGRWYSRSVWRGKCN